MKLLACFALSLVTLAAAAPPAGMQLVTSVEGVTEYRLDNGLQVLVFPDPSKPTITVNMTYLVGSRHEGAGERGMAHLLEHMMFKGSPGHKNIPEELTSHGSRPNGTTDYDRTNYFETFSASEVNLRWALDLESDRMVNSYIAKKDFDSEYTVVRNEFESGENNPMGVLVERTLAAGYVWHPYGRAVIGNRSDIENVPIDKLQAFYKKYYQPDNAVLTVAGKIDEAQLLPMIVQYFGKIPKPTRKLDTTYTKEPVQDGERFVTVRRVGDIQAVVDGYHIPAGSDKDFPAVDVLSTILTDNPSGRLYKALVDNKKASQVFGWSMQQAEPGMLLLIDMLQKTDSIDDARNITIATVENLVKEPPSKEEVERAKTRMLKEIDLAMRDSTRIGLFMSEWAAMGDWRLQFLYRDRLRDVSPADVQRVAAAYLKSSNRTIGEFIPDAHPDRAEVPAPPDVEAMLKGYKGDAAMSQGEAFDPSPSNIEARVKRSQLPNGMKLELLSKKTRGNSVHATLTLHLGTAKSLFDRENAGDLMVSTLLRGTKEHNRQQLQDEFDRLKAQVNIFGSASSPTVVIETVHDNLPAVLKLVAEVLKEPTFPEDEINQQRKQQLTQAESGKSEPQVRASVELEQHLYPYPKGDIRHMMSPDEEIADLTKLQVADIRKFYTDFMGGSHAELAVVGDFDEPAVKSLAADLFGNWTSPGPFENLPHEYQKIGAINQSVDTPDKENAMFLAAERLAMSDTDPDYPAMVLANYMIGGGFLNSRLATRIRQKEGLSYGIGSQFNASEYEKNGSFRVYAIAAPQNVAKVEAAFKDELSKAIATGFTADEVKSAKSGWLQSRQVNRSDDGALARLLAREDHYDRKLTFDADLETQVGALTPDQVNGTLKRTLDPSAISYVKAGDWKKAAQAANVPATK
jgi:zinc protease